MPPHLGENEKGRGKRNDSRVRVHAQRRRAKLEKPYILGRWDFIPIRFAMKIEWPSILYTLQVN